MINFNKIESPCYVLDEDEFRKNLSLIASVGKKTKVDIILAFKSFAQWKLFPIIKEYVSYSTASSLSEARLAYEEMGTKAHTYSPAYTVKEFPEIACYSSHITFNSLSQFERFYPYIREKKLKVSCGLRINPEYSEVETDLYNPCAPGSRLGVTADKLKGGLPKGIEGFHFHTLCESTSYDLEKTLQKVEEKFGDYFLSINWLNLGGGHLMTSEKYDVNHLIKLLFTFREKYPHLHIIMEPGSAFAWQCGYLVSSVVDIVENKGICTAILDVSFACHMPDCLEMPYQPKIIGASSSFGKNEYRMGGNSCLSGDYIGTWFFDKELKVGDKVVFEDMFHYTIVKTTMFNGVSHPSIALWSGDNSLKVLKKFTYEDYKNRMD